MCVATFQISFSSTSPTSLQMSLLQIKGDFSFFGRIFTFTFSRPQKRAREAFKAGKTNKRHFRAERGAVQILSNFHHTHGWLGLIWTRTRSVHSDQNVQVGGHQYRSQLMLRVPSRLNHYQCYFLNYVSRPSRPSSPKSVPSITNKLSSVFPGQTW